MTTLIITDERFLAHDPGPGHPEAPARLRALHDDLAGEPIPGTTTESARPATPAEIERVHSAAHCAAVEAARGKHDTLDEDTSTSPGSVEAAHLAAGAAVQATTAVMKGEARNAFVLCRPPGHHAESTRPMGFCLFNNVAIAAEQARALGAERVMILDWDVHHGNGTQHHFEHRRDVLFLSAHQFPFYPGTGAVEEIGRGEGQGFTINCALPPGQGDADYGAVFHELFLPIANTFEPDIILVSAGFDAHRADPLGEMQLSERGFAAMASATAALADEVAGGRLVMLLEGGYHLRALTNSVRTCLEVMTGGRDSFPSGAASVLPALRQARSALARHWRLPALS